MKTCYDCVVYTDYVIKTLKKSEHGRNFNQVKVKIAGVFNLYAKLS